MRRAWGITGILLTACLAACQDPGCIRHSECPSGYECRDAICASTSDAGSDASVAPDASSTPACTGSACGSDGDAGPAAAQISAGALIGADAGALQPAAAELDAGADAER